MDSDRISQFLIRWRSLTLLSWLLIFAGCATSRTIVEQPLWAQGRTNITAVAPGPTLHLDYLRESTGGNPISEFMYFVPLISPEPVSIQESPGNTQRARVISARRRIKTDSFSIECEFEINGAGLQRNEFDHTNIIRRREAQLKQGSVLERQLAYINVNGGGHGRIEVEGTVTNRVPTVSEVRLVFDGYGQPTPISIGLQDIRFAQGEYRRENETVAEVNTLSFKRGKPKMDVTVGSVKRKDAGAGLWQSLVGSIKGTAANMLLKPLTVDAAGHRAMLDFGLSLAAEEHSFTFPKARNLKSTKDSAAR